MFNFFFKQTEPLYIYGKGTGPWGQLEKEWLSFTKEKLRFPLKKYLKRAVYSIFYGAEPEKVASLIKEEASSEEEAKTLLSFFLQSKLNQVLYEIKKNMQLAVLGGCLFPLNPDILEKFKDPKWKIRSKYAYLIQEYEILLISNIINTMKRVDQVNFQVWSHEHDGLCIVLEKTQEIEEFKKELEKHTMLTQLKLGTLRKPFTWKWNYVSS